MGLIAPGSRPETAPAQSPTTAVSPGRYTGIVVNHTHWDREWYMPFQRYRVLLVDAVDRLLDALRDRPDFAGFTLDGQTVVVEDYLEVRSERRPELVALTGSGRLQLGPWYVLPDEFIPSPESLVRNLLLGRRQMRQLEAPAATVGYLPDTFGHPAQLPQLLAGFDLDSMVIFRGVQSTTSEFIWQAPDGSGLLTIYLPGGYYNAMELARAPDFWLREKLAATLDQLTRFATTHAVLLMNGSDHFEPQPATQEFLDQANRLQDRVFLRQGTLQDYVGLVQAAGPQLEVKQGEWRYNRPARITPGVLSSRMYLKQADFRAATLLERGAEPLQAMLWSLGGRPDDGLLATAWRYLLQNHPHDSICGCSVDEVHLDGEARYRWASQIGGDLVERAACGIANRAAGPDTSGQGFLVFNTLAVPRAETVRQQLHFLEPGQAFELRDSAGQPIAYQELRREPVKIQWDPQRRHYHCEGRARPAVVVTRPEAGHDPGRWQRWLGAEVELLFEASLPAGGFAAFQVVPLTKTEPVEVEVNLADPLPAQSSPVLENDLVRVEVASNGSFRLLDKATGRQYGPLHIFRSEADRGDEYSFCPVAGAPVYDSREVKAEIRLVENGPLRSTLEIRLKLAVPARLTADRAGRAAEMVELPVRSLVSLEPGRRRVEIVTELENNAADQRLRVLFDSGVRTATADAQGQFMVMRRPVDLAPEEQARVPEFDEEQEVNYHPQRSFVDVSDERSGLAVLNRGLPEYEASSGPEGVELGLTLLRCVGWLSRDDLSTRYKHAGPPLETPQAQCPGRHRFEYALVPHTGDWLAGGVAPEAEAYVTPVYSAPVSGQLPGPTSFYRLEPSELLFSACKPGEDGQSLILRAYNTAPYPVEAVLRAGWPAAEVRRANLAERDVSEALVAGPDDLYRCPARPHEIVTFSIRSTGELSDKEQP